MYLRWLALTAVAYVVLHHLGLLPGGLGGAPDDTQWADWLDLVVPFLVLGPAAATLTVAGATARTWSVFGVGALLYASGHGIHLAANSVANAHPSDTAHLWDEVVGHQIWYAGVALVVAALARTMSDRPRSGLVGLALAVLVGVTWATNAIGGGTQVFSVAFGVGAAAYGWRRRRTLEGSLLVAGLASVVVLVGHAAASAL